MATSVQYLAKNVKASNSFTSLSYKTEQRGAWSLDIVVNNTLYKDIECTLMVSNNNNDWFDFIVVEEKVNRVCGASFAYNEMPYDYMKVEMSGGGSGDYDIIYNERWRG